MSSKENIKYLLSDSEVLENIINDSIISIDDNRDLINLSVWWIITKQDKYDLLRLLDYYKNKKSNTEESIDPNLLREFKKIWVKIIRYIDSIWKPEKYMWSKISRISIFPGLELEYLLIDSLSRLHKDKKIKIEKWPNELDWKKIDFILNQDGIKLWVQLTLTILKNQNKKRAEVRNVRNNMNNKKWNRKQKESLSSRYISDAPLLMIIDPNMSKTTYKNRLNPDNVLKDWQRDWFPSWWPSPYLCKEKQKKLEEISISLYDTIKTAFNYIKEIYERWEQDEYEEQQIKNMYLIYNWSELEISYYKNEQDWRTEENFLYSIEIFITDKLIEKLLANHNPMKKVVE